LTSGHDKEVLIVQARDDGRTFPKGNMSVSGAFRIFRCGNA